MSIDNTLLHFEPYVTRPRDQAPVEAPRVTAAQLPTSWSQADRNGALPMRTAGAAPGKRLPANAPVTVPPGLVITVCPSMADREAARRAAQALPLVGEPLRMHADWVAERNKSHRRAAKRSRA